jgi:hypothetical protein
MPKALCITGLAISAVLLVLFLWDLVAYLFGAATWLAPFKGAAWGMDLAFILCSAGLGYLSWITWKENT